MVDNNKMKFEYDLFADVWKLFKSYCGLSTESSEWNEVLEVARELEKKYKSQLCNDLLVTVIMELERECMQNQDKGMV